MSFELLAPHYTWLEVVLAGRRLQRSRTAWLEALEGCREILIAGIGHGHFLRRCAARFPDAQITAVDSSRGMLRQAEARLRRAGRISRPPTFLCEVLPQWQPPPAAFDAIVTHFFLDCFAPPELNAVVAGLARAARPRVRCLVADFTVPPAGMSRVRARLVHRLMYTFFRRTARVRARCVTDPDDQLRGQGFTLSGRKTMEWGMLRSDVWSRG